MRFFQSVTTLEELKKEYRRLTKQYHPDLEGGCTETMKQINLEYEAMENQLSGQDFTGATGAYRDIINSIIQFDLDIEVIGSWVWVQGDTYPIKEKLSDLGFKWSRNKKSWYWHEGEYTAFHKKTFTLDEIRIMHNSQTVRTSSKVNKELLS